MVAANPSKVCVRFWGWAFHFSHTYCSQRWYLESGIVESWAAEGSIWFCDGWKDFVEFYSISVGHFVPKEFADKNIVWNQFVDLQTCGEKQWRVRCYCHTGTSSAMRMGKGWAAFSTENHLEEEDVYVFDWRHN